MSLINRLRCNEGQFMNKQKHPSRGVLIKSCSKYMQHIYRRTPMPKYDFNKVSKQLWYWCSPANLLHIFSAPFPKNTYEGLLLNKNLPRN